MPLPTCSSDLFGFFANLATILTAGVAVYWFRHSRDDQKDKQQRLEAYLTKKWLDSQKGFVAGGDGNYRHSIIHLMAKLGLTEDEILRASFNSDIVIRELSEDNSGIADGILFQHKDAPRIKRTKPVRC